MNCKDIQELLPAYEGQVLTAPETAEVKGHLAACKLCQKELGLLSAAWAMLGVLEPIQPSAEFRPQFWEKVRREEERRHAWFAFPRLVPTMASFLGIWVAGVGLGAFLFMHSKLALPMVKPTGWSEASLTDAYVKRMGRI
jgi:hypothetical protein